MMMNPSITNAKTPIISKNNSLSAQDVHFKNGVSLYGSCILGSSSTTFDDTVTFEGSNNQLTLENSTFDSEKVNLFASVVQAKGGQQRADHNVLEIGLNVTGKDQGLLTVQILQGAYFPLATQNWGQGNQLILRSPIRVTQRLDGFNEFNFDLTNYKAGQAFLTYEGKDPIRLVTQGTRSGHSTFTILNAPSIVSGQDLKLIHSVNGFVAYDPSTQKTVDLAPGDYSELLTGDSTVVQQLSLARQLKTVLSSDEMTLMLEENGTDASQDLVLTMDGGQWSDEANDQTSALMESALSSLGALTAADDLFMDQALRDQVLTQEGPFVAARTGRWSFDTNTRIESNITSAVMGYGHEVGERTHVGLFVEMGLGAYKTRTGLSDGTTSQGSGSQNYAGLGLFAMHKLPIEGLLLNGYVKAGGLQNHFDITMMNQGLAFNRTAAYWGANLGVMFDYPLTTNVSSRSYLQYFYDGLGSQTFDKVAADLAITSSFHYDAIHAHRIQLGTQVTYNYQPNLKPFIGLALEDAIQAKATGTATDSQGALSIKPSDMEGVTALLSAGWKYESEDQGLNVGLSATGYGGARNGVSAQVQATWTF